MAVLPSIAFGAISIFFTRQLKLDAFMRPVLERARFDAFFMTGGHLAVLSMADGRAKTQIIPLFEINESVVRDLKARQQNRPPIAITPSISYFHCFQENSDEPRRLFIHRHQHR